MTPRTKLSIGRIWVLAAVAAMVAACGGASPTATVPPIAPTVAATVATTAAVTAAPATAGATVAPITAAPITAPPSTAAPVTAAPSTAAPPTSAPSAASSGPARLDLAFTKTRVFFENGSAGACRPTKVDGATRFWFEATDYGSLGERFTVKEVDGKVVIDWVIDTTTIAYANNPNVVIKISANHRKVTLDQDLLPLTTSGGFTAGPQHVKGTITCS